MRWQRRFGRVRGQDPGGRVGLGEAEALQGQRDLAGMDSPFSLYDAGLGGFSDVET